MVRDRRWNSERFIVCQKLILQQARHVAASQAIQRCIEKRMDAWGVGKHAMLVEDTLRSCEEYLTVARREETAEHWAQTYHSLVLRRKLRTEVRWITERENGRSPTAWGQVYKDGGPGDGGAPHQTPRGPDTYVGKSGFLPGTTTGTHSGEYH